MHDLEFVDAFKFFSSLTLSGSVQVTDTGLKLVLFNLLFVTLLLLFEEIH